MAIRKVSVSLDAALVEEARELSKGNLSAYINEALLRQVKNQRLGELLDAYQAEHGAFTEEELAEADRLWPRG